LLGRWRNSEARGRLLDWREERSRTPWPASRQRLAGEAPNVAIVVVNWNTRLLIAQLVFSLFRILGRDQFAQIVVVDNGSSDGSRELLEVLSGDGLIHFIANPRQRYHGPALNQGLSWLAERQRELPRAEQIDYVWVLDSDVVVLRRDTLLEAVSVLERERAAAVAQTAWHPHHRREMLGLYSLVLDPGLAWQAPLPPFREHGDPSAALQAALRARNKKLVSFPFVDGGYLLHVGRGTLAQLAKTGAAENRYFAWATDHNEPHFAGVSEGQIAYAAFLELIDRELPVLTPERLVDACGGSPLLTVSRSP
jgi:hypothetical protein